MCLKKRFVGLLRRSITLLCVLSLAVSIGVCSASALEPGETQYLLQDGQTYTVFCLPPNGGGYGTYDVTWTSSVTNRIAYEPFFSSVGGGYFYNLTIGVENGSLFTILPGQTVKISTLVTDFQSETFENMNFQLVYTVNGQTKTISKVFSGTVLESEAFFVIKNDSSSNYEIASFSMSYESDTAYTASNFGFRNPTVYMYDQSDKILAGFQNIFGESYDQPDNTAQEDYENNESQVNESISGYLDDFGDKWGGVGYALGDQVTAFYGFMGFFNLLAGIPIIDVILTISICIGVFGLLLGIFSSAVKGRS